MRPGGAGAQAGIEVGQIVHGVNGIPIDDVRTATMLVQYARGDVVFRVDATAAERINGGGSLRAVPAAKRAEGAQSKTCGTIVVAAPLPPSMLQGGGVGQEGAADPEASQWVDKWASEWVSHHPSNAPGDPSLAAAPAPALLLLGGPAGREEPTGGVRQ